MSAHEINPSDPASVTRSLITGQAGAVDVARAVLDGLDANTDQAVFISRPTDKQVLDEARAVDERFARLGRDASRMPLAGLCFAVKDNIDVAGLATTAACAGFARMPAASAPAVERLRAAGAVLVGKTNLDQFATGLTGCRSPFGTPRNAVRADLAPGGSSSGSAVAVARGLVHLALGTDTAGSGRVPAALNAIVGLKPSRGIVSTRGLVPACASLDCVSVFTPCVGLAKSCLDVLSGFDPLDPFAREPTGLLPGHGDGPLRLGVLPDWARPGQPDWRAAYEEALALLAGLGAELEEVDFEPFAQAGRLLYEGPWIAERWGELGGFVSSRPGCLHPVTKAVLESGRDITAAQAFAGFTTLAWLTRKVARLTAGLDAVVMPTIERAVTLDEERADPFGSNTSLGRYTTFANLLDLCALSLPASRLADQSPFGVTLYGRALGDARLARIGALFEERAGAAVGASGSRPGPWPDPSARVAIGVVGAHLSGQPLNWQLTELGARLVRSCRTAPLYRMYALEHMGQHKPGVVRARPGEPCGSLDIEVWELPAAGAGRFLARVLPPLGLGNVVLEDGQEVKGFVCEEYAVAHAPEITAFGGWRGYLAGR